MLCIAMVSVLTLEANASAGVKGEPTIPAQRPGQVKAWESWHSEDCGASSSSNSSNASSLSLPLQESWEDILAQMPSADAAPMLWQSHVRCAGGAKHGNVDRAAARTDCELHGLAVRRHLTLDDLTDMLLPPLPGALQQLLIMDAMP